LHGHLRHLLCFAFGVLHGCLFERERAGKRVSGTTIGRRLALTQPRKSRPRRTMATAREFMTLCKIRFFGPAVNAVVYGSPNPFMNGLHSGLAFTIPHRGEIAARILSGLTKSSWRSWQKLLRLWILPKAGMRRTLYLEGDLQFHHT